MKYRNSEVLLNNVFELPAQSLQYTLTARVPVSLSAHLELTLIPHHRHTMVYGQTNSLRQGSVSPPPPGYSIQPAKHRQTLCFTDKHTLRQGSASPPPCPGDPIVLDLRDVRPIRTLYSE